MIENIFFEFSSRLLSSTFQAAACGLKTGNQEHNEYRMLVKGNSNDIRMPVIFKHDYGKKLTDILDTGSISLYLISDRLKTVLYENHLTGWETFPIKLYDKNDNEIFGYHGFSVTGKCAQIDYSTSEILEKRSIPDGPLIKYYKGIPIDYAQWDGSDFFSPLNNFGLYVTKKTAQILIKNKITNLRLTDAADIEIDLKTFKSVLN